MERSYESMMIIRPDMTEEELQSVLDNMVKKIEDLSGKVSSTKIWARDKSFTFTIRSHAAGRKKYNKGCYWLVNFDLDTEKLEDFKKVIKLEENILRSLIVKDEKKQVSEKER